jgi:tryptophan synthase alpha chain
MSEQEQALRSARDGGRKLLVPFVTGGLDADWLDVVRAVAAAGADAVEVGLPFSDPIMDGPVIQAASARALAAGATPAGLVAELAKADAGVPLVVMTSYNLVFRAGHRRFARSLAQAGVAGAILPDLPLEEIGDWARAADDAEIDTILLVAPTTPDQRLAVICDRSRGWVYAVGHLGVTGERTTLATSAELMGKRVKAVTDKPVLVGIGVSSPAQAAQAAAAADGVIVGSALVRRLLDGAGPDGAAAFVSELRAALD